MKAECVDERTQFHLVAARHRRLPKFDRHQLRKLTPRDFSINIAQLSSVPDFSKSRLCRDLPLLSRERDHPIAQTPAHRPFEAPIGPRPENNSRAVGWDISRNDERLRLEFIRDHRHLREHHRAC